MNTSHLFLAIATLCGAAICAEPVKGISESSLGVREKINLKAHDGCGHINGFNYQPSWGTNGVTVWGEKFDAKKYREELMLGKKYFPKFNAVRMWLSWSAYRSNPDQFIRNFKQAVDICGELDLLVVPILFNLWPGTPLWDHVASVEITGDFDVIFAAYIRAVVTPLKGDKRILVWDLCNEPYWEPANMEAETVWLGKVHVALKQCDPEALTCVGVMPFIEHLTRTAHLQDILTPHLYYPLYSHPPKTIPAKLEDSLVSAKVITDSFELGKMLRKPVMTTECCWGAENDAERAVNIRINLELMNKYKIGFFAHALYTSGVADLHKYKEGYYMPFILEDGSLRPEHDIFNEFAR